MNLVGNAIKFTETGSVRIVVRQINAVHGRARLRFEVSDTGIGIPPDRRRNFRQLRARRQFDDAALWRRGLGLAICKQLISLMGGEIDAEQHRRWAAASALPSTLPIVALASRAILNADFNYLQVMVMDEENSARYLLAQQLRLWGTNVIEASSRTKRTNCWSPRRGAEKKSTCSCATRAARQPNKRCSPRKCAPPRRESAALVQLYDDEARSRRLRHPAAPSRTPIRSYDLLLQYLNGESSCRSSH